MKCKDCPLYEWEYSAGCEEWDVQCIATMSDPVGDSDEGGCTRSNKWILAQDKEKLKNKYYEREAECMGRYMNELIICDDCKKEIPRQHMRFEKSNWSDKNQCFDCFEKEVKNDKSRD